MAKKDAPLVGHKRKMRTQFLNKKGPTFRGRKTFTRRWGPLSDHVISPTKRHGSFPTAWKMSLKKDPLGQQG